MPSSGLFPGGKGKDKLVCLRDYEEVATKVLPRSVLDYYRSGACNEETLRSNMTTFSRLRLRPRILRDVRSRSLSTTVLGHPVSCPIGVAPTAMQKLAHPDGEVGNAKAVERFGSVMILSTLSTTSMEEIAEKAPSLLKWFQLYVYSDRDLTRSLVQRAEAAGYKALVLTVDTAVFGIRYRDARNSFSLPPHLNLANFSGVKAELSSTEKGSSLFEYVNSLFDPSLSWRDVAWLRSITSLPIVLKGILTGEDAKIAADLGVDAILVSNHGGRQLDSCPSTLEALPEVVRAVAGRCEVYLDGGVRHGTDVFKALTLGAKMVFVGRPVLWGLATGGSSGVSAVLNILLQELDKTLALTGCTCLDNIRRDMVVHESHYAKL